MNVNENVNEDVNEDVNKDGWVVGELVIGELGRQAPAPRRVSVG